MSGDGAELARVKNALAGVTSIREVRMFGGTAFMVNGHMTVAVSPRGLLVRVGPEGHDEALKKPSTRAMQMRGRIMVGYVYVQPVPTEADVIEAWVQSALRHNRTLPPKKAARTRTPPTAPKTHTTSKKRTRR
jgi:TfoX/Sxy family transcriptional regulator of competence genes